MKIWRYTVYIVITGFILGIVGFGTWASMTYKPSEELKSYVNIEQYTKDSSLTFVPEHPRSTGIILYPGAKIEPTSYSYFAKALYDDQYVVIVPKMPFNLALFERHKADDIKKAFPNVTNWVIGGHSLGGVVASSYVSEHPEDQLLLLASYPSNKTDLSKTTIRTLSIYADQDELTTTDAIMQSKKRLPQQTVFKEIKGGNHSQFGMYGPQKKDGTASISPLHQQQMIAETIAYWLKKGQ